MFSTQRSTFHFVNLSESSQVIYLVLPHRIGDSILSLPSLYALKNLVSADVKITLVVNENILPIFSLLNVFPCKLNDFRCKLGTWLSPPNKIFFYNTTSKVIGFRASSTLGECLPSRVYGRFDVDMPSLSIDKFTDYMNLNLITELKKKNLSNASIRYFGVLEELGFSNSQIIDSLKDFSLFPIPHKKLTNTLDLTSQYVVICAETAYGSQRNPGRTWKFENFIKLAEALWSQFRLESLFVGTVTSEQIDSKFQHIKDLRGKTSMNKLINVIQNSAGYIGNDTGTLHIANLLGIRTIGIYLITSPEDYSPVFAQYNIPIQQPQSIEEVLEKVPLLLLDQLSSKN